VLLVLVGVPAALLRASCVGSSCNESADARTKVPFCSLPISLRRLIENGFREGRSPDLFVVDRSSTVYDAAVRVPLVFSGAGVSSGGELEGGVTLDRVAPTMADILGLRRPHPDVRSGIALEDMGSGSPPRLVFEVVWKGGETNALRAAAGEWPNLQSLIETGVGTLEASPGSLPLDATAVVTTIGTGGMPSQHGITGSVIRALNGRAVQAWGRRAPTSVIATLADDLDEKMGQRAMIGLIGTARSDRGLIGGNWYIRGDRDDLFVSRASNAAATAERVLRTGYGDDEVPDLLAVVITGDPSEMDVQLAALEAAARRAADGSALLVFTATGPLVPDSAARDLRSSVAEHDVIEEAVPGGLFLDQRRLADGDVTEDDIVDSIRDAARGAVDVFSETAITFSKYC
jgi:hypothetical protein